MSIPFLTSIDFTHLEALNFTVQNLGADPSSPAKGWTYFNTSTNKPRWFNGTTWDELSTGAGTGTVTSVSVVSANGFAGSVATASTTPAITISTTITGLLKGNGTAISAATSGTDFAPATSGTAILKGDGAGGFAAAVSSTDYAPATSGTNGYLATVNGSGGFGTAVQLDTDGTLTANSDTRVATQKAVKTYVASAITSATSFKGTTNCSTNPNYPAATAGDLYIVSTAGKIGGASGTAVDVGDAYIATATNAGGTQASVGASWDVLEHNLVGALLAANNLSDLANAGTARTNLGLGALATLNVGAGLSSSGGNLLVDTAVVVRKFSQLIGNGASTSLAVTHSLGTQDITVSIRDATTNAFVWCDVVATSTTVATFTFAAAPASSAYRVVVHG